MIHEAVVWSNVHKKWFFLPRKASKSKYNDVDDERHGTNLLLVAGDYFLKPGGLILKRCHFHCSDIDQKVLLWMPNSSCNFLAWLAQ